MSAADNGGPAFPKPDSVNPHGGFNWGDIGMSLRDYFIAHAPAEPQPWFTPAMPTPVPERETMDRATMTDAERNEYAYVHEYFRCVKPDELKCDRVREYTERAYAQHDAIKAWQIEAEKQRYVQWPAAWADAMLAARSAA